MMQVPISTLHLFTPLEQKLIELLKSLSAEDWNKPTVAKLWTVKDVAAHLLDGNMRVLASAKGYTGDPPGEINSYQDLVSYLNKLNADWVKAMRRVSPDTIIKLLEITQKDFIDYYHSLDLYAPASFSVAWAGEETSPNWFHIAREYTERWHHQQQIRDAVNKPGIMEREFFFPLIQTFMMALLHTYRNTKAPDGTVISVKVVGETGGDWRIKMQNGKWQFTVEDFKPTTIVELDPDTSWKLFTKALDKDSALKRIQILGDLKLAEPILTMTAIMG
jgi:uncharacterized protein (TIGR03083 family)